MEILLTFIAIILLVICIQLYEIKDYVKDLPERITKINMDLLADEIGFIRDQVDGIKNDLGIDKKE